MADADTSRQRQTKLSVQATGSHYCRRMERTSTIAQARVMVIPVLMSSFSPSNPDVAGCSPSLPSREEHGNQRHIPESNFKCNHHQRLERIDSPSEMASQASLIPWFMATPHPAATVQLVYSYTFCVKLHVVRMILLRVSGKLRRKIWRRP